LLQPDAGTIVEMQSPSNLRTCGLANDLTETLDRKGRKPAKNAVSRRQNSGNPRSNRLKLRGYLQKITWEPVWDIPLVELRGIEPLTSSLRTTRSPS
jgi:hypothetical protein